VEVERISDLILKATRELVETRLGLLSLHERK